MNNNKDKFRNFGFIQFIRENKSAEGESVRKVIKSANLNYVDMGFRPRTNNECPLPSLRVHAK